MWTLQDNVYSRLESGYCKVSNCMHVVACNATTIKLWWSCIKNLNLISCKNELYTHVLTSIFNNYELSVVLYNCSHFLRKIQTISFSYEVFNAFIVYLYTDEIHIKLEHVEGETTIQLFCFIKFIGAKYYSCRAARSVWTVQWVRTEGETRKLDSNWAHNRQCGQVL